MLFSDYWNPELYAETLVEKYNRMSDDTLELSTAKKLMFWLEDNLHSLMWLEVRGTENDILIDADVQKQLSYVVCHKGIALLKVFRDLTYYKTEGTTIDGRLDNVNYYSHTGSTGIPFQPSEQNAIINDLIRYKPDEARAIYGAAIDNAYAQLVYLERELRDNYLQWLWCVK